MHFSRSTQEALRFAQERRGDLDHLCAADVRWELGGSLLVAGNDEIGLEGQFEVELSYEQVLNMHMLCMFFVHLKSFASQ